MSGSAALNDPLRDITERFYEFESELSLFKQRIDGAPV